MARVLFQYLCRSGLGAVALVASLGLDEGCGTEEIEDPRREVLVHWVDQALLVDYQSLVDTAHAMELSAARYCEQPTPQGLEALRAMWWQARAPWKRSEVFAFGPYADNPWRLGAKIDFWPARPEAVEKTLAATELELTPEVVASLGAAATGLPALEYLLFHERPGYQPQDPRSCAYIQALCHDLVVDSQTMLMAWSEQGSNYRQELVFASPQSQAFEDLDDALAEVVNRIGFTLENIRRDKLMAVLGSETGGVDPTKSESQWSGRSVEDILDNLRGMERLVFGPQGRNTPDPLRFNRNTWTGLPTNLVQMLEFRGIYMHAELAQHFTRCFAAFEAMQGPLAQVAAQSPEQLLAASDALGALQTLVQTRVLEGLSLSITFNDADGD